MELKKNQLNALIFLRILVGWHFAYEAAIKWFEPGWTAKSYLATSQGPLQLFFGWLAQDPWIGTVDFINLVGLTIVGALLLIGTFERPACLVGIALLASYYLAHPPFFGLDQGMVEGHYWLVNKNLIELAALIVLYLFPTGWYFGLDRLSGANTHLEQNT